MAWNDFISPDNVARLVVEFTALYLGTVAVDRRLVGRRRIIVEVG